MQQRLRIPNGSNPREVEVAFTQEDNRVTIDEQELLRFRLLAEWLLRSKFGRAYCYGGYDIGTASRLLDCVSFSTLDNSWLAMADLPSPARFGHAAVTVGSKGYCFGGSSSTGAIADCDELDPIVNAWTGKTASSVTYYKSVASTINNRAYVYGGFADGVISQGCDEFDPQANAWTAKTAMPSPARASLAAVTLHGSGYVFAGAVTGGYTMDCDAYDPVANAWSSKTDVPGVSRNYPSAVSIGDDGYVFGGGTNYGTTLNSKYSVSTNSWTAKTELFARRFKAAASEIGGVGYLYAGFMEGDTVDCVAYDVPLDAWTGIADMPLPERMNLAASSI